MKQKEFFDQVQQQLGIKKASIFKAKIAKMLDISESGAYKKISGITQLTLSEMNQLCDYMNLKVSIVDDKATTGTMNHSFAFHCDDIIRPPQTYEQWASNVLNHSLLMEKFKPDYKVISYQSEISYFHLLPFKNLLYFKLYAWNRSSWEIPMTKKFNLAEFRKNYALNSLLDKAYEHYISYKSIEIWHIDFLDGVLSQLKYYYQLDIFEKKEDVLEITRELSKLLSHLEEISKEGQKKLFGKKKKNSPVDIYVNYMHTSSSLIYIESPQFRIIYDLFLHPNYIRSQDEIICQYTDRWLQSLINQSELISGSGELIRNKFFMELADKIDRLDRELRDKF